MLLTESLNSAMPSLQALAFRGDLDHRAVGSVAGGRPYFIA
jgi:hypothetical protein